MRRRVFNTILVVLVVIISSVASFAIDNQQSEDDAITKTVVVQEKAIIESLASKSNTQLESMGYTASEIDRIREMVAKTNDPIRTEKYGSVKYTIKWYKSGFYYKNGVTYLKTNVSWSWSSVPLINYKDIIATTTSKSFTKDSAYGHVNYYEQGIKDSAHKDKISMNSKEIKTKDSMRGVFYRIKMVKNRSYALGGSLTVYWSDTASIKSVGISGNYGHAIASLDPGVSFPGGTEITFTPSLRMGFGDEAAIKATR